MDFKKILSSFSNNKKNNFSNLVIIFLIGVLLVIAANFFKGSTNLFSTKSDSSITTSSTNTVNNQVDPNLLNYEAETKNELKTILQKIDGVGNTEVMINYESGEEQVPVLNENKSISETDEKDTAGGTRITKQNNDGSTVVMSSDGNKSQPFIVKTYKPKVSAVFIVAEGADNEVIQLEIKQAVVNYFNLPINKVNVFSMKK
jgi:stage III sporulation protein AG